MLRRVALVRIDVSEQLSASFIRVTRIGELGTTQAATSNRRTLRILVNLIKEAPDSSETSVLTRATWRNIPEDTILHHQVFHRSVRRLLVTASVVPSSLNLVTLKKNALSSSETLVLTRATRRNIPEDAFLHSHRLENLKSYRRFLTGYVQRRPGFKCGRSHVWDMWWTERRRDGTLLVPRIPLPLIHSTNYSTVITISGLENRD
jgi:hypothetical protein